MPRGCGCAGNSCGCLVTQGSGITVTGTGNASDPFIISAQQSGLIELGPYTAPGASVDLTGIADGNATVVVDYETNLLFEFSANAPIGTRVELRAMPSFGSTLTLVGNVWHPVGQAEPIPAPATGNLWISAVKMDALNWFVRVTNVAF